MISPQSGYQGGESKVWNGILRIFTEPQPVPRERPGEVFPEMEALPLSEQQHHVVQTGESQFTSTEGVMGICI